MGNGVLVYFGYPQAHEDDAERAVRTGLELMAVVSEFTTHARGAKTIPFVASARVDLHQYRWLK